MAENVISAAEILAEIQSESLQSLLAAVRRESDTAGKTYIPALDAHLASVNARRTSHDWPLNRGDVLEIQGPAGSGKTQLLYHMLATCLIPLSYGGMRLDGWGQAAIFFDTDGSFNISRLHKLLVSRLRRVLGPGNQIVYIDELASRCLKNLHVFRPTSSLQLAVTLLHLPRYHATDTRLKDQEIGLVVIDSLSAFYWRDRYTLEQLRDAADGSATNLPPNPLYHVVNALQQFRISHRPVTILSNWGLNTLEKPSPTGEQTSPYYRQHLYPFPAPFEPHGADEALVNIESSQQNSVRIDTASDTSTGRPSRTGSTALPLHYHITLHPSPIDPFPAAYTLEDAISQEDMRAVLVTRGEVRGLVRSPDDPEVGEFTFRIGEDEILVDPPPDDDS